MAVGINESGIEDPAAFKLALTLLLGIPYFLALDLALERQQGSLRSRRWLLRCLACLPLAFYFYYGCEDHGGAYYLRYAQFSLAAHLAVALAPFAGRGELRGFWQFNRSLFVRFCVSLLYAVVFFCGVAIALLALDGLLGVKIDPKLFLDLWYFSVMGLQTIHFLAGVPQDTAALDLDAEYPRGLKVFTLYLLLPLVFVYTLILYAYLVKIALPWDWLSGSVSWLVAADSVFGMLCMLLLYPLRLDPGHPWIGRLSRGFYMALSPLLGMLLISACKRIGQYGVTERRYLLLALGLWLLGLSVLAVFRRLENIKWIPLSLAILALGSSCGPWGAYSLSRRVQFKRLEALLTKNSLLCGGTLCRAKTRLRSARRTANPWLSSWTTYAVSTGLPHFQAYLSPWTWRNCKASLPR